MKTKKFWSLYVVCFLIGWHFVGNTIYNDLAHGLGFIGISTLVGFVLLFRAKNSSAVRAGHLVHVIILFFFCFLAYQSFRDDLLRSGYEECLSGPQVVNSDLPDDLKKQFCNCFSSGLKSEVGNTLLLNEFLFRETTPIQGNIVMQEKLKNIWQACEAKI